MKNKIIKSIICILLYICFIMLFACSGTQNNEKIKNDTKVLNKDIKATKEYYEKADLSVLKDKKIGITVQSLINPYWAGVMSTLEEILKKYGAICTIVSCDDIAVKQISNIENFIASGCDIIMAHPSDADALEDVFAEAKTQCIKLMCWDNEMENSDVNWVINNEELGYDIGKMAAEFINKYYTSENKVEVIVIGYNKTQVLLERENGIKRALEEFAKDTCEIVASQEGIIPIDAQNSVETILQAHPNAKIVVGVASAAMIGADEALNIYTNGDIPENMGVFSTDVTKQQLEHLIDEHYPAKGIIGFEGSDYDTAYAVACMYARLLNDEIESKNVYRGFNRIDIDNVKEIYAKMK